MANSINISASHLVIIEWLHDRDPKIGTELTHYLSRRDVPVRVIACRNKMDVIEALENTRAELISSARYPVIQFDCHGNDSGFSGPDGFGGKDVLEWDALAPHLRLLNILTRFNLIILGAACQGLASVKTFQGKGAAPFTIAVGFHDKISAGALLISLKELHRGLFKASEGDIKNIVKAANRELTSDEPGRLLAFDCLSMGATIVKGVIAEHIDVDHEAEAAERQLVEVRKVFPEATLAHLIAYRRANMPAIAQKIIDGWFAYADIPENKDRFPLDVKKMYSEAWANAIDAPPGASVTWPSSWPNLG